MCLPEASRCRTTHRPWVPTPKVPCRYYSRIENQGGSFPPDILRQALATGNICLSSTVVFNVWVKPMPRASPESPRMFERDLIDYFSRTHPLVVPALYVPGSVIPFVYAAATLGLNIGSCAALAVLGFVTWTLTEYWLHRTVFHLRIPGARGQRFHFLIHGVHHQWPKDRYRLVMPPAVSITLYCLFAGLFHQLLGPRWMWPFHSGFVAGYLVYDMSHYSIHHVRPRSAWGRMLRRHHMLHHFKDTHQRFGVSTMFWDWVFGTAPSERSAQLARESQN